MAERIYIFKRFERFWHWSQAALIIFLLTTGFEVHGSYHLFGYKDAATYHTIAAWTLVGLRYYLTGIFTNAPHPFRQTTLTKHNPLQRLAYLFVLVLINPLIWITGWFYLFYNSWSDWGVSWLNLEYVAMFHVIGAFMMLIFLIAHVYLATAGHTPTNSLALTTLPLKVVALVHLAGAFAILSFLVVHVYMTTTGHSLVAHIKAMITGWEEVED